MEEMEASEAVVVGVVGGRDSMGSFENERAAECDSAARKNETAGSGPAVR